MMKEYIEREALLSEYDRRHKGPPGEARKIIESFPAADVQPIKHGKWEAHVITDEDGEEYIGCYECSNCGLFVGPVKVNYCLNCGSDMREN